MSYYVFGHKMSYVDYLTAHNFVSDINKTSQNSAKTISSEISKQTRALIASNDTLLRNNIRVVEDTISKVGDVTKEGFEKLSYEIKDISDKLIELNATFHWGFGEIIAVLGHMSDELSELIKIAKTPVQTIAYNHFEIARDAFRQGLYEECLEELDKAIKGDHVSSGYKLEWRFHQLRGVVLLGFSECDTSFVDLVEAEKAFLKSARYAKTDYPNDASRGFLSAGWASYCQGKLENAFDLTTQSMSLNPKLAEASFQGAKILMALNKTEKAFSFLTKAIEFDSFFALKAASDGDFKNHNDLLLNYLEGLRKEKYSLLSSKANFYIEKLKLIGGHSEERLVSKLKSIISGNENLPLMDILDIESSSKKASSTVNSIY